MNRVRISNVVKETDRAKTFVLESVSNEPLTYAAGQFLTFSFPDEQRRSYSISAAPLLNEPLSITIKAIPNGLISRQMTEHAKVGDEMTIAGIGGRFVLPEERFQHYFFLAAGSGIVPCYSLLKTVLHTSASQVTLVYSNTAQKDTIFLKELNALQQRYPLRFYVKYLWSDGEWPHLSRMSKVLLNNLLKERVPDKEATIFYTCGPELYMAVTEITLLTAGISSSQIKKENFDTRQRAGVLVPPDTGVYSVVIRKKDTAYTLSAGYPYTVLAAAKKAGINLPYSCEAGRCSACVARCTKGKVWMQYNEVLTDEEVNAGLVLTCQSFPQNGEIMLEY